MLDERKEKAISMLIKGESITNIAVYLSISRQTVYDWINNKEFANELDKRRQEIKSQGNSFILSELRNCIDELLKIALKGESEKVRSDTAQYLVNRVLGTPTNKIEQTATENKENISTDMIDKYLQEQNEPKSKE